MESSLKGQYDMFITGAVYIGIGTGLGDGGLAWDLNMDRDLGLELGF